MQSEDDYRHDVFQLLVEQGGYQREQIAINFPVRIGSKTYRADLAIHPTRHHQGQNSVCMIVECKRPIASKAAFEGARLQLQSYLLNCPNAWWGVLFSGDEPSVYYKGPDGLYPTEEQTIPRAGAFVPGARPNLSAGDAALERIVARALAAEKGVIGLEKTRKKR